MSGPVLSEVMMAMVEAGISLNRASDLACRLYIEGVSDGLNKASREAGVDEQAERRRAADRERKSRYGKDWADVRLAVLKRDGFVCTYCQQETDTPHVDHVMPISRGGTNDLSNLVVACPSCNVSKKDRTPEEWRGAQ